MKPIVIAMIKPHGRNRHLWAFIVLAVGPFSGCAARQLQYSTGYQATTITDIQYEQVLNNLARLSQDPNSLPSALDIKTGSTQVSDTGNIGATITYGMGGARGPNFGGSRSVVDQWGSMPITEDNTLKLLSYAYLNAYGHGKLLSPEDANDMAFDLATQMATTADISTDADTWKSLMSLRAATPLEQADVIVQNTNTFKGNLDNSLFTLKGEYQPEAKPVAGVVKDRLSKQDLEINKDIFAKIDRIKLLIDYTQKLLKNVKTNEELTIARELENIVNNRQIIEDFLKQVQNFKSSMTPFDDPNDANKSAIEKEKAIKSAFDSIMKIKFDLDAAEHGIKNTYDNLQKSQSVENQYTNTSKTITTIFDEPMLIMSNDGMFVSPRIATGLVKAVRHKVNDIQKTLKDVPVGWFHVGHKRDVPKNACYVGRYISKCGECTYAWVCDDGTAALADFTLRVLKLSSQFKEAQVFAVPSGVQFSPALASPR